MVRAMVVTLTWSFASPAAAEPPAQDQGPVEAQPPVASTAPDSGTPENVAAGHGSCPKRVMCTTQDFVTRLIRVADETKPSAVGREFNAAFGTELQRRGVSVFVSMQEPKNTDPIPGVRGVVMLGDVAHPLNFGDPRVGVTIEMLDRMLTSDGWSGGTADPLDTQFLLYRKGHNEFRIDPMSITDSSGNSHRCARYIVVFFK
jgi:hypothetical protein